MNQRKDTTELGPNFLITSFPSLAFNSKTLACEAEEAR